eukprot:304541_1
MNPLNLQFALDIYRRNNKLINQICKKYLTTKDCCFMSNDIIKMRLYLNVLELCYYINNEKKPRHIKSIKNIENGEYKLSVWIKWVKNSEQSMQILNFDEL